MVLGAVFTRSVQQRSLEGQAHLGNAMAGLPAPSQQCGPRPLAEGRARVRCFLLRGQSSVNAAAPTARACLCRSTGAEASRVVLARPVPTASAASNRVARPRVEGSDGSGGGRSGASVARVASGAGTGAGGAPSLAQTPSAAQGAAALRGVRDGDPGNVVWVSETFDAAREAEAKTELARRAKCRPPAFRRTLPRSVSLERAARGA